MINEKKIVETKNSNAESLTYSFKFKMTNNMNIIIKQTNAAKELLIKSITKLAIIEIPIINLYLTLLKICKPRVKNNT
ncbi:hypothetical protein GCM10008027_14710 [Pseudoalteromonas gelatinilytica]|uniref:Uncharacterized protein n=1 Tax=Pseudoalteromonas gelatinilytica TaxID=1703256 RepID=A0ABQ1TDB0_9GAMM|nr:hypothetical protein GCM10008027_14710 [Pseudoalteromonas profundi]